MSVLARTRVSATSASGGPTARMKNSAMSRRTGSSCCDAVLDTRCRCHDHDDQRKSPLRTQGHKTTKITKATKNTKKNNAFEQEVRRSVRRSDGSPERLVLRDRWSAMVRLKGSPSAIAGARGFQPSVSMRRGFFGNGRSTDPPDPRDPPDHV